MAPARGVRQLRAADLRLFRRPGSAVGPDACAPGRADRDRSRPPARRLRGHLRARRGEARCPPRPRGAAQRPAGDRRRAGRPAAQCCRGRRHRGDMPPRAGNRRHGFWPPPSPSPPRPDRARSPFSNPAAPACASARPRPAPRATTCMPAPASRAAAAPARSSTAAGCASRCSMHAAQSTFTAAPRPADRSEGNPSRRGSYQRPEGVTRPSGTDPHVRRGRTRERSGLPASAVDEAGRGRPPQGGRDSRGHRGARARLERAGPGCTPLALRLSPPGDGPAEAVLRLVGPGLAGRGRVSGGNEVQRTGRYERSFGRAVGIRSHLELASQPTWLCGQAPRDRRDPGSARRGKPRWLKRPATASARSATAASSHAPKSHTTRHSNKSARVSPFRPGVSPGSGQPTPQGWPLRDLPVGRPLPFARADTVSRQGLSGVSCSMPKSRR